MNDPQQPIRMAAFRHWLQAEQAVQRLNDYGFQKEEITVIAPDTVHLDLGEKAEREDPTPAASDAPLLGSSVGALLGGLSAGAGVVASGGAGLLMAGAMVGASLTGAVTGGFVGLMAERGMTAEAADFYDQALDDKQILVAVEPGEGRDAETHRREADGILARAGGVIFTA